jgi:arginase
MPNPCAILEAPSTLGLATNGVERLPNRLLDLGLASVFARAAPGGWLCL